MVTEIELFESADPTPSEFSLKSEIYKMNTRGDLFARIFDAAACILESEN